eukprot:3035774-Rhodomonas_salina.4
MSRSSAITMLLPMTAGNSRQATAKRSRTSTSHIVKSLYSISNRDCSGSKRCSVLTNAAGSFLCINTNSEQPPMSRLPLVSQSGTLLPVGVAKYAHAYERTLTKSEKGVLMLQHMMPSHPRS